jgi:hypothetical protein
MDNQKKNIGGCVMRDENQSKARKEGREAKYKEDGEERR